jgi:isopentenyldiphosphate isomerase
MADVSERMTIDVVDGSDDVVGKTKRSRVLPEGLNFRTVHVLILNEEQDKILLQQPSRKRKRHSGYFGSSVAGYLFSGESYEEAAVRRTPQELGVEIDQADLHACDKQPMEDKQSIKFVQLYILVNEGPFPVDTDHVQSIKWMEIPLVNERMQSDSMRVTPTFKHVWNMFTKTDYNNLIK